MAQEHSNDNRGVMFENNDKREGKKDPDLRGNVKFVVPHEDIMDLGDGTAAIHRFIQGWMQHSAKCGNYISISVGDKCSKTHSD